MKASLLASAEKKSSSLKVTTGRLDVRAPISSAGLKEPLEFLVFFPSMNFFYFSISAVVVGTRRSSLIKNIRHI